MNGAEHYRESERLLSDASFFRHGQPFTREGMAMTGAQHAALIARAQVHATLALAAAQAAPLVDKYVGDHQRITDWAQAIGYSDAAKCSSSIPDRRDPKLTIWCDKAAGHDGPHAASDGYMVWPLPDEPVEVPF